MTIYRKFYEPGCLLMSLRPTGQAFRSVATHLAAAMGSAADIVALYTIAVPSGTKRTSGLKASKRILEVLTRNMKQLSHMIWPL
jgi:hypothetical protein